MSFAAINEEIVSLQVTGVAAAGGVRTFNFFNVPRAATIVNAYAANESVVATADTTSFLAVSLLNGGTAGTSTLTIATSGSAATPHTWTANQGYTMTFDTSSNKDLTASSWVCVREEGTSTRNAGILTVCAHVVLGTGRVS